MESSSRNVSRNSSHNEGPLLTLADKIQAKKYGFYYQYCNNSRCREITLLILPANRRFNDDEKDAFLKVVNTMNVPGLILEYPEEDKVDAYLYGDNVSVKKDIEWSDVLTLMHNKQLKHEQASSDSECAKYEHAPLPKGKWKNADADTRFSNEIRSIPGVRHIDVDGIFHCPDCNVPLFMVEATSDGCPGTPWAGKFKATTMTRKLAEKLDATPLMIQHHYADDNHEHPVYLTSWTSGKKKVFDRTWDQLVKDFDNSLNRHRQESCTANGNN